MKPSYLVLETGEIFEGRSPEWQDDTFSGEIVFNTGMVGYVESLTDPSYKGQILTFSYPLIGNYGVPAPEHWESRQVQAAGMICSELADFYYHHEAEQSLSNWLKTQNIPMLTGVDTRALVKTLRSKGVVLGAITSTPKRPKQFLDVNQEDLVGQVTCSEVEKLGKGNKKVVVVDCGIKQNILRHLQKLPVEIIRVPYDYDYSQDNFDGVFISNGPGDPAQCTKTISILKKVLKQNKPMFGICLGSQILALAVGAKTYKLPFGHRAQNHPCIELETNKCFLTSQNHGYAVDEKSLPKGWKVTYKNLNDGTVQGIAHTEKPFFAVQFHPEASPGPIDTEQLFERFYELL
ncbi:MAG: glutamine-hydrolyzing carbamoyl-phosphate synthase small subunit [Gammaproteobacteria bacterium]